MSDKKMRINLKIVCWLVIVATFLTTISYWTKCGEAPMSHTSVAVLSRVAQTHAFAAKYSIQELQKEDAYGEEVGSVTPNGFHKDMIGLGNNDNGMNDHETTEQIDCVINGEYTVGCRRDGHEVYVPFTFLHKYFEVYGKVSAVEGQDRFEWQHSYSKYYNPKAKYDPLGVFMNFENFNVEARDRVKCISAMDGVPVSTQWDIRGYLYPIQIAQFALSHFSKNITEPKPRVSILEDGKRHKAKWSTPDGSIDREFDKDCNSEVLHFSTSESLQSAGIALPLDQTQDLVLSMNLRLQSNGSVSVLLEDRERREHFHLHYVCSHSFITASGNHIYYGMGERADWFRLTRDVAVDLRKGLALAKLPRKTKAHGKFRLLGLTVRGQGSLDNVTLATTAHLAHFRDACEWLLRHQDEHGGWPIPVERKFNAAGMGNLEPGWYSAMAQGQAMSALTRAYHVTGDERYRQAALRAVEPFGVTSEENGVLARFLGYDWYEEYPTVPGSFVLNGFMYALVGLYDVRHACASGASSGEAVAVAAAAAVTADEECRRRTDALFERGMSSLKAVLPLFDSGVGSFYDLRHFTLGIAPNLARWDYHTTHIGQLLLLSTVDGAAVLKNTANRWIEYMKGKRAPHN